MLNDVLDCSQHSSSKGHMPLSKLDLCWGFWRSSPRQEFMSLALVGNRLRLPTQGICRFTPRLMFPQNCDMPPFAGQVWIPAGDSALKQSCKL
jgi:hypothetical protein